MTWGLQTSKRMALFCSQGYGPFSNTDYDISQSGVFSLGMGIAQKVIG